MQKYAQFTAFLAYKYNLDPEQVTTDLNEFCKEESVTLAKESVADDYKTYLEKYVEDLELEYNKKNDFQTNTRGIKIRGVFPSQEEAEIRAKLLRENDPHFDVYVGPVGVWMPWEPDAYRTGQVHFLESQLNELMSKKQQNEASAKEYFDKRVKEAKRKAIEENVRKARESGNKLSQSIDANDNLVNVKNVEDIQKTLFETENVVTDKNSDHGLSELKNSKWKIFYTYKEWRINSNLLVEEENRRASAHLQAAKTHDVVVKDEVIAGQHIIVNINNRGFKSMYILWWRPC